MCKLKGPDAVPRGEKGQNNDIYCLYSKTSARGVITWHGNVTNPLDTPPVLCDAKHCCL